ncbi:DNA pilot protein [Sigmofec virus UA08Rod_4686]|uniref:DNA pilot protein n=1 Tax=Sigmofec virus UA08Rod_4686 TaxID=2929406 RepID=A0A976N129_9VIRU|nr:DNA pilot protein [Sigmofec virus UA08Rod_4686]
MILPYFNISSALIGGVSSLIGSGIQALTNNYTANRDFKRSKELMEIQHKMNIEDWNMKNAYDSPSAVMSRLKQAGLNPDLVYGSGAGNMVSGSVNSSGLGSVPQGSSFGSDLSSSVLNGMSVDSQIQLNKSLANKADADANNTNANTPWVSKLAQSSLKLNDANVKLLNESVEKIRNESELLKVNTEIARRQNELEKVLYDSKVNQQLAELGASEAQSKEIISKFSSYYNAQIQLLVAQAYNQYKTGHAAAENAAVNAYNAQMNAQLGFLNYEVNKTRSSFQNALDNSNIDKNKRSVVESQLVHQWREDLNSVPIIGRPISGLLGIPSSILTNVGN